MIELAITAPIISMLLFGMVSYGTWISLAHAVQQSANEGARAAIAGLSQNERASIARQTSSAMFMRMQQVDSSNLSVTVQDDGATLIVSVAYNASGNPFLKLPLVPFLSTMIERSSAVKLSGL